MSDDKKDKLNLYQKLLKITEEIGKIEKTGKNTMQNYAFIEQAQVVAELRPQLAKWGVIIMPETISRSVERYEVTRSNGRTGVDIHANVVSRYTIINADDPAERFVCEWDGGEAIDSSDKATNKATTASHKYFLMKLFNISDKDDADADSPEPASVKATPAKRKPAFATEPQIKYLRQIAGKKSGTNTDDIDALDMWLEEQMSVPPQKLPIYKVTDAVEFLNKLPDYKHPSLTGKVEINGEQVPLEEIPF